MRAQITLRNGKIIEADVSDLTTGRNPGNTHHHRLTSPLGAMTMNDAEAKLNTIRKLCDDSTSTTAHGTDEDPIWPSMLIAILDSPTTDTVPAGTLEVGQKIQLTATGTMATDRHAPLRRLRLPLNNHGTDLLLVGDKFEQGGLYVQVEVNRAESEAWSWLEWDERYDILAREWHDQYGNTSMMHPPTTTAPIDTDTQQ